MKKRNVKEIKVWMIRNSIKLIDISSDLGFDNKTVWSTLHGHEHNRKVLSWFVEHGCPSRFLALPADMKEAA